MAHHKFPESLIWRREGTGLSHAEIDTLVGADAGTCRGWEDGSLGIPSEPVLARLASILDCGPSALKRSINERAMEALQSFARAIERAIQAGQTFTISSLEAVWRQGRAAKSSRGGGDDDFWDEQIEKNNRRPGLPLD